MEVTKYEIDMLSVGAADAFLIRFFDEKEEQHVILVSLTRKKNNTLFWLMRDTMPMGKR